MQIRYSIILLGFLICHILFTANKKANDNNIQQGKVVDTLTGCPLPFVQILNESTRKGYITDSTGKFRIPCKNGDTLVFISLGYLGKVVIADTSLHTVFLKQRTYNIDEVSIQTNRSYEQFKRDFLEIEPEKSLRIEGIPEGKPIDIPILLDTNYIQSDAFAILNPISFLYYKFSKEEKSKRKAFYLKRQEGERLVIDKKFNREIVHRITGLGGDELTNFIGFCNFSHKFLYEATELEIVNKIYEKFEIYKTLEETNEENSDSRP